MRILKLFIGLFDTLAQVENLLQPLNRMVNVHPKWHLLAKDVGPDFLQSRVTPVEDPVVFSERLRKLCGLVLNQNLHEKLACQNW
jgi:hypothetical protein